MAMKEFYVGVPPSANLKRNQRKSHLDKVKGCRSNRKPQSKQLSKEDKRKDAETSATEIDSDQAEAARNQLKKTSFSPTTDTQDLHSQKKSWSTKQTLNPNSFSSTIMKLILEKSIEPNKINQLYCCPDNVDRSMKRDPNNIFVSEENLIHSYPSPKNNVTRSNILIEKMSNGGNEAHPIPTFNFSYEALSIQNIDASLFESLVDSALHACKIFSNSTLHNDAVRGAAVLTSTGQIYNGCDVNVDSSDLSVSAEKTALLKAVSEGHKKFHSLLIISDGSIEFPNPSGNSRQFLAEFGDFPVYLVNKHLHVKKCTTHGLYPIISSPSNMAANQDVSSNDLEKLKREPIQKWTEKMVQNWLKYVVCLQEYSAAFQRSRVDGNLLVKLSVEDLSDVFQIKKLVHQRRIIVAIEEAKDKAAASAAAPPTPPPPPMLDFNSADRLKSVSPKVGKPKESPKNKHKKIFFPETNSRLQPILQDLENACKEFSMKDGELHPLKARQLFEYLGHDVERNIHAKKWCESHEKHGSTILFSDLVLAYYALFHPNAPACKINRHEVEPKVSSSSASSDGSVEVSNLENDIAETLQEKSQSKLPKDDSKGSTKKSNEAVKKLTRMKKLFDRFSKNNVMTSAEAVQALIEAGVLRKKNVILKYLKSRGFSGVNRDISFFEFMRAFAALTETVENSTCNKGSKIIINDENDRSIKNKNQKMSLKKLSDEASLFQNDDNNYLDLKERTAKNSYNFDNSLKETEFVAFVTNTKGYDTNRNIAVKFELGDLVNANYKSLGKFYRGRISNINDNGTYDVRYNDGDFETSVPVKNLNLLMRSKNSELLEIESKRRVNLKSVDAGGKEKMDPGKKTDGFDDITQFTIGEVIMARHLEGKKYIEGVIKNKNNDGTYSVDYISGMFEENVAVDMIRKIGISNKGKSPRNDFQSSIGDFIEVFSEESNMFCSAKIKRINKNGTFDVEFDDGRIELSVEPKSNSQQYINTDVKAEKCSLQNSAEKQVQKTVEAENSDLSSNQVQLCEQNLALRVGEKVEARYMNSIEYYPGIVEKVNDDNTYNISYDDGDKEQHVPNTHIKRISPSEINHQKSSNCQVNKTSEVLDDNTADKKLVSIESNSIDSSGIRPPCTQMDQINNENDIVDRTKYHGSKKFGASGHSKHNVEENKAIRELNKPYKITNSHTDSVSSVKSSDRSQMNTSTFSVGDQVEANYLSRGKYYSGRIKKCGYDKYDIEYDDGAVETNVPAHNIRGYSTTSNRKPSNSQLSPSNVKPKRAHEKVVEKVIESPIDRFSNKTSNQQQRKKTHEAENPTLSKNVADSTKVHRKFIEGQLIEARYMGRTRYYRGVIDHVNGDETYNIKYNDGIRETGVEFNLIRKIETGDEDGSHRKVDGTSKESMRNRSGGVNEVSEVELRNENELSIVRNAMKYDSPKSARIFNTSAQNNLHLNDSSSQLKVTAGSRVEARFGKKSKYYPGVIKNVNRDGTFDILYDDDDKEFGVSIEFIKVLDLQKSTSPRKSPIRNNFNPGDKVEARFKGRQRYYSGTVTKVNFDRTCDLRYDDGDIERGVSFSLIRHLKDPANKTNERKRYAANDQSNQRINPNRHAEKSAAEVENLLASPDSTFCSDEESSEIKRESDAVHNVKHSKDEDIKYEVGTKVEARYRDGMEYVSGVISYLNFDNTYDIDYDDGRSEMYVKPTMIRLVSVKNTASTGSATKNSDQLSGIVQRHVARSEKAAEKRAVQGETHGTVAAAKGDDAAKSSGVEAYDSDVGTARKIASPPRVMKSPQRRKYAVGDRVKARFESGSDYLSGRVTFANADGSYDIEYDNGEKEFDIEPEMMQTETSRKTRRSPMHSEVKLQRGDAIEARYKGRSRYFPGVVKRVNADGTVDIDYDDGDFEAAVMETLVRRRERQQASISPRSNFSSF